MDSTFQNELQSRQKFNPELNQSVNQYHNSLVSVGSEVQFNNKFSATTDNGFGQYKQDYTSPMTYRANSPSPMKDRNSLTSAGNLMTSNQPSHFL